MKNNNIINDLDKIASIELENVKRDDNFRIIKRSSYMYNCISYSIDVDSVYIWPSVKGLVYLDKPKRVYFWPRMLPLNPSLDNFKNFYKLFAFEETDNPEYELGYRKISVYVKDDEVTHASVIQSENICMSKMGYGPLITHTFGKDKENGLFEKYGNVIYLAQRELLYGRDFTIEMIKKYSG